MFTSQSRRWATSASAAALVAGLAVAASSPSEAAAPLAASATNAKLTAVSSSSPTDAWAVGFTQQDGGHNVGLTRHWDGTRWKTVDSIHPLDYSFTWGVADLSPT